MKLCFSTLGCPGETIERIAAMAAAHGMNGVELMGGVHGHVSPERGSAYLQTVRDALASRGIAIPCVTAYTNFSVSDRGKRLAGVEELTRYGRMAAQLGSPYVRAFIGTPDIDREEETICREASEALTLAARSLGSLPVRILVETHDWVQHSRRLVRILEHCPDTVGVLWDFAIPYAAGEPLAATFEQLKERIRHVHVKDKTAGDFSHCAPGDGCVPIAEAAALLRSIGYDGYCSLEWERAWLPELAPLESLLPGYRALMLRHNE